MKWVAAPSNEGRPPIYYKALLLLPPGEQMVAPSDALSYLPISI